jgi:hypothetical protein
VRWLIVEYFVLLRSQIKDGAVREETHLDVLGVLKSRIASLEKDQTVLRSTNTRDKRTIEVLSEGGLLNF